MYSTAERALMSTIKQIADLAGVSRGTVDRVLNHRGSVNPETEEKIKQIMQQLDYKPNRAGMALAAQKKKCLIGVILFSKKNPFFDDVMKGFLEKEEELSVFGCELSIKRVAYNPQAQLSAIHACLAEHVQGLIITPYNHASIIAELNSLIHNGIPVMTVNSDIEGTGRLCYVGSHYYESGKAAGALMKLVTSDQVRFGVINGDLNILCHAERFLGFTDELSDDSRFQLVAQGENYDDDQTSYELVLSMLQKHPEINALYFTAAGVYGGCRAIARLKGERDIRVITFDDVPTTIEMLRRGIITATICQEPYWQGARSLELMFSYLNHEITDLQDAYYADLHIKIREIV